MANLVLAACTGVSTTTTAAPTPATPTQRATATAVSPAPPGPGALPEPGVEYRSHEERAALDVLHYEVDVDLRQMASGLLEAHARLAYRWAGPNREALNPAFDLVGLRVDSVRVDGTPTRFEYDGRLLELYANGAAPSTGTTKRAEHTADIYYGGHPLNGLFFGTDSEGAATAFADNWPNRARWWFPANDDPADKATVRWRVAVPEGWAAVANGQLVSDTDNMWVWETHTEIPVYTMVVGAARFERMDLGESACGASPAAAPNSCTKVSVWALSGDGSYGAKRFARAAEMVSYYAKLTGEFPYAKLAHVESATRFGGMENSSAIFYARAPWEERRMDEGVIAHETAHQWFGDSITPCRWSNLWLSEGFASYFGPLFFRARDGEAVFRELMAAARQRFLKSDVSGNPVVAEADGPLFTLLNPNNYQKGAWILHMLRGEVGDSAFFRGIRSYYRTFRQRTACTDDFERAMESEAGRDLAWFFDQWLHQPGYPRLKLEWEEHPISSGHEVVVIVNQEQPPDWPAYRIRTDLLLRSKVVADSSLRRPITLKSRSDTFFLKVHGPVSAVEFDPDHWILATVSTSHK